MDEKLIDEIIEKAIEPEKKFKAQLEERSEEVQEFLSVRHSFLEKYALVAFMVVLLFIFATTYFIQYPDTITVNAKLTATNAPKDLVVRQDGLIVRLSGHNNEMVKKGTVLGWIESTAHHEEVLQLSQQLDTCFDWLNKGKESGISMLFVQKYNHLGEIQQEYQIFMAALQQFNDYKVNGFYQQQKDILLKDIKSLKSTNTTIQQQKNISEQDEKLAEASFSMNEKLYKDKVIAEETYRTEKSKLLNKQSNIPVLNASILNNETQQREKQKAVSQIEHDVIAQVVVFQQALLSFKSTIDNWKKRYTIESPIDGILYFTVPVQENKYMVSGKKIGYISPDNTHYYAEVTLPQTNFGKLDTGMKVQLRFDAYSYQEVGFVSGTLSYISKVPSDSGFLANIRLDNGLITNRQIQLGYRSGLSAQAVIITRKMRLIQKIFNGINTSFSK